MWLLGTLALLTGYLFQAAALDRGRLAIIQPLLVTTVVFALPLGYLLTSQRVTRRQVGGAAVILLGLGAFTLFGDPAGGRDSAPGWEWAIVMVVVGAACGVLLTFGGRGGLSTRAAVYGTASGMLFGLSAAITKPTVELLHEGIGVMLEHWEPAWHIVVAVAGLLLALIGAVLISLSQEAEKSRQAEPTGHEGESVSVPA